MNIRFLIDFLTPKFGGGGGTTTSTQKSEPWKALQPYLKDVFGQAQGIYQGQGPEYYPDPNVVPFSPISQLGLQMMQGRAFEGSPLIDESQSQLQKTIGGDYLNANPYLDAAYERGARAIMPSINATFGMGGRTGSGAHQDALGTGLADLATGIYGGNYQQERDRQMAALGMAPSMSMLDYADLDRLLGVGSAYESKDQQYLQDQINRFDYYQNLPTQKLEDYAKFFTGNFGGKTTTTQPTYGGDPLMQALGLGLTGLGAFGGLGSLFGPTLGAAGSSMAGNQIPALWM